VAQGTDPQVERGPIPWVRSESTDFSPPLDAPQPNDEPSVQPTANPQIGSEHRPMLDGTDRGDEPVAIPSRIRTDSALNELASERILMHGQHAAGSLDLAVLPANWVARTGAGQGNGQPDQPWPARVSVDSMRPKEPSRQPTLFAARLAAILLAAGLSSQGVIRSTRRNPRDGRVHPTLSGPFAKGLVSPRQRLNTGR
jgi:hypothetical protein